MNLKQIIKILAYSTLLLLPFTSIPTHAQEMNTNQHSTSDRLLVIGDPLPKISPHKTIIPLNIFSPSDFEHSLFHTLSLTRTVTVLIAADEEYRAAHPDWKKITKQMVGKAANSFRIEYNINFSVKGYTNWKSDGTNSSSILDDLNAEWKNNTQYDFVVGFTKDSNFTAGGIAYVYSAAPQSGICVVLDQGTISTPYAIQHEWSHNYGLSHDTSGSDIKCIMNYDYAYSVNYWDPTHNALIKSHLHWYGKKNWKRILF
ncbi:zinc-dependent metalloprotease [Bacillus cereus group sp. BfR-BA-01489]|uniref:zinc-dependent metalloprotease n=1 Tax=Bacillus cereus group sp. BfR-BA-01489 TaxID=2920358 RepID=UPI001F583894